MDRYVILRKDKVTATFLLLLLAWSEALTWIAWASRFLPVPPATPTTMNTTDTVHPWPFEHIGEPVVDSLVSTLHTPQSKHSNTW